MHIPRCPPDTLAMLASFMMLKPPLLLCCVQCHTDYTKIENGDQSCHDCTMTRVLRSSGSAIAMVTATATCSGTLGLLWQDG